MSIVLLRLINNLDPLHWPAPRDQLQVFVALGCLLSWSILYSTLSISPKLHFARTQSSVASRLPTIPGWMQTSWSPSISVALWRRSTRSAERRSRWQLCGRWFQPTGHRGSNGRLPRAHAAAGGRLSTVLRVEQATWKAWPWGAPKSPGPGQMPGIGWLPMCNAP
jgi:hypothetical protein